jgi:hypothetical protein
MTTRSFATLQMNGRAFRAHDGILYLDAPTSWHARADVAGPIGSIDSAAVSVTLISPEGQRWTGLAAIEATTTGPALTTIRMDSAGPLAGVGGHLPWGG